MVLIDVLANVVLVTRSSAYPLNVVIKTQAPHKKAIIHMMPAIISDIDVPENPAPAENKAMT